VPAAAKPAQNGGAAAAPETEHDDTKHTEHDAGDEQPTDEQEGA
jgi:hypothetical protein